MRSAIRTKIVPSIEFTVNSIGRAKRVDAPDGGELVDICDEYLAPIPFSCRSASCGTCHVEVLAGAELLEPPSAEEAELLSLLGGGPNHRLACQARVRSGPGVIRLRAVLGG
jgi:ferredoxin